MKIQKFSDWVMIKEDLPPTSANSMQPGGATPMTTDFRNNSLASSVGGDPKTEIDTELHSLQSNIKIALERFMLALDKHKMPRHMALDVLHHIAKNLGNEYGFNDTRLKQAVVNQPSNSGAQF